MSFLECCTTCLRQLSISDSSPYQSGLFFLSWSVVDLRTLVFELCVCKRGWGCATPLFCKLLSDPSFVPSLGTLIALDFLEGFPMVTEKLAIYFLKLILYAIWHFKKVACIAQNFISLVDFSFKQTCSKKFEFWWRELKLNKFKKHWSNGEAFCRVDCLDRLVFTFS